ncbi:hypothetical protein RP726_05280 [Candidatus Methylospira mobilis]|uniref:hypothetical protein n=1 Tax=Candidatus Methylospira mobilis TaxID=1808979 RepID=UPI0028EE0FB1|nr:hypothetical protein [Candidatus Methylospira mobilis]WNV05831.1 hypothetical protein RP726_05280 [Candidatus Methylospira mobilis]
MAGAAEGKVVANLFAPAGDWDVPAGFAKNGDTLLEWHVDTIEIREQFPLCLETTRTLALRDREQCEASGSSSPRKL